MSDLGSDAAGTIEERSDIGKRPNDIVAYWLSQEKLAETETRDWRKRGHKVVKRYRDERPTTGMRTGAKFNILWANVQVLKPVLYARTAQPDIAPRWKDTNEEVVRLASDILERSLRYLCDRYDIDAVIRSAVEDRLLPGFGTARVRYVPTFGDPVADPEADEPGDGEEPATFTPVESEEVNWEYVFWNDFAWGPCRRWEEAPWIRFRSYLTRDELIERFGEKIGKAVTLDYTPKGMEKEDMPPDLFKKATVLEFWDKTKKQVVWIAMAHPDEPLDTKDDPLGLEGFYPCPKPLLATTTNDKLVPVPDFAQYQDQADQLDIIAARIDKLTEALKVAGVYAASEKAALSQLLQPGQDNLLIPVEDWAVFAQQKGGLEGTILWLPIQVIAEVLEKLYEAFDRQKEQLYEVSGLSDIMRGATEASETATAQRLKSQYGSVRVQDSQKDVARFSRDLFRLAAQVVSNHLDPKTISEITGLPELPQPVAPPVPPTVPPMPPPVAGMPGIGAPSAPSPQPQVAPAPPPPAPPAMTQGPQPGAGATPPAQAGATPPVPSSPDPMAKYQQDLQAFQAYQAEVQSKTQQFEAACALLKNNPMRTFRLDIEADSTIAPDEQAEKQSRTEFATAVGSLLQQAAPLVQQMPQAGGALVAEVLKFVTHGFRAGRPLEETIDKFADYLDKLPPATPHTDPALIKAQAAADAAAKKTQADIAIAAQAQQAENEREAARLQIEQTKAAAQIQGDQAQAAAKVKAAQDDVAVSLAKIEANERIAIHGHNLAHERAQQQMALDIGLQREKMMHQHSLDREKAANAAQAASDGLPQSAQTDGGVPA